ncbi:TPA: hypothetical protein ACR6D3_001497, partial [Neisseria meningitidis]
MTHKNAPKNFQLPKTFPNIEQKVGKIRKVLHFENEIEHKILVTYVIAKVSALLPYPDLNLTCHTNR